MLLEENVPRAFRAQRLADRGQYSELCSGERGNQEWLYRDDDTIFHVKTKRCLGMSHAENERLVVSKCDQTSNQRWKRRRTLQGAQHCGGHTASCCPHAFTTCDYCTVFASFACYFNTPTSSVTAFLKRFLKTKKDANICCLDKGLVRIHLGSSVAVESESVW